MKVWPEARGWGQWGCGGGLGPKWGVSIEAPRVVGAGLGHRVGYGKIVLVDALGSCPHIPMFGVHVVGKLN